MFAGEVSAGIHREIKVFSTQIVYEHLQTKCLLRSNYMQRIQLVNIARKGMIIFQQSIAWLLIFQGHSILPGTRHSPSWLAKKALKGLWKAPGNQLSL